MTLPSDSRYVAGWFGALALHGAILLYLARLAPPHREPRSFLIAVTVPALQLPPPSPAPAPQSGPKRTLPHSLRPGAPGRGLRPPAAPLVRQTPSAQPMTPTLRVAPEAVSPAATGPSLPVGPPELGPVHASGGSRYGGGGGRGVKAAANLDLASEAHEIGESCHIPDELYPEPARREGRAGTTRLGLAIAANGRVEDTEVVKSAGGELDELARQWAKRHCRFEPALDHDGQPVDSSLVYTWQWIILRNKGQVQP